MDDKKIMAMLDGMKDKLSDDKTFLENMQRNLDFAQQAKLRNDTMVKESRRRLLWTILSGIIAAVIIVVMFLIGRYIGSGAYTTLYAVISASLTSVATLIYGLVIQPNSK